MDHPRTRPWVAWTAHLDAQALLHVAAEFTGSDASAGKACLNAKLQHWLCAEVKTGEEAVLRAECGRTRAWWCEWSWRSGVVRYRVWLGARLGLALPAVTAHSRVRTNCVK